MNLRRIVAALILAVSVLGVTPAHADLDTIRQHAESGDAQAQLHLGILYEFGFHLADHDIKAMTWYTLAADQGNKEAARRRDLLAARLSAKEKDEVAREVAKLKASMPEPAATSTAAATAPKASGEPADGAGSGAATTVPAGDASKPTADAPTAAPAPATGIPAAKP
ncbi:MAG: hypothetical protein ACYDDO_01260 [Acidiferrobacterales bacterium]